MHIFAVYTHNVTQYTSSVHLLTVYVQWLQKAKNALIIISFFYLPHPPNIESFGNFRFELTVTKIMLNFLSLCQLPKYSAFILLIKPCYFFRFSKLETPQPT